MGMKLGILKNRKVIRLKGSFKQNMLEWEGFMRNFENRRVATTEIGNTMVSTVFLGLDHQWWDGHPKWFETMAFGAGVDQQMTRCETWEQAEQMHKDMRNRVFQWQDDLAKITAPISTKENQP